MKQSIILKTLLILGSLIVVIFIAFGYLMTQNDRALIADIREYNLNSTMKALDSRQEERLKLNQLQMKEIVNTVAKNTSSYLLDYDLEGLKKTILFDMKKDGIKAIKVWDYEVDELFLLGVKDKGQIYFADELPKEFELLTTFEQDITNKNSGKIEKLGKITFYYDESEIINQINLIKKETIREIDRFNSTIDMQLKNANTIKSYMAMGALVTILVVMSFLLFKFVNRPLKALHSGLDSFFLFLQGKRDHAQRIELESADEFGQMAHSLNDNIAVSARLHEELNSLYADLEQKVELRTKELAQINQELEDSIEYASTIQKSFLKNENSIQQQFDDAFVIWEPRDKVGGDLYIYEESSQGILIGVVDCTGHSVPGGFMTMLAGSTIKNLSLKYFNNPAKLLSELNSAIKHQLGQDKSDTLSDDGMDMGLCYINNDKTQLTFSGAKLDLLYVKEDELSVIKSNKQSIGYKRSKTDYEYTNHTIHIESNESFYLYSDGITDQTGGEKNFPFGNKKFKKLIESIQDRPMSEQKTIIITNLLQYQNSNSRRDDITVVGFQFKKGEAL